MSNTLRGNLRNQTILISLRNAPRTMSQLLNTTYYRSHPDAAHEYKSRIEDLIAEGYIAVSPSGVLNVVSSYDVEMYSKVDSRAYTVDECLDLFMRQIASFYRFWLRTNEVKSVRQRMVGLVTSIMNMFDGNSNAMPKFHIVPKQKLNNESQSFDGLDWWPEVTINGLGTDPELLSKTWLEYHKKYISDKDPETVSLCSILPGSVLALDGDPRPFMVLSNNGLYMIAVTSTEISDRNDWAIEGLHLGEPLSKAKRGAIAKHLRSQKTYVLEPTTDGVHYVVTATVVIYDTEYGWNLVNESGNLSKITKE